MSTIRLFCLASLLTVVSSVAFGSDIMTTNGVLYSNIKRVGGDPSGVKILHKDGVDYTVDYIPFSMMKEADRKKYGDVVTQGYREAANRFRKAAEAGDRDAMFNLAVSYAKGEGVAKDDAEAFKWYLKASEKDNAAAMYEAGICYLQGKGIEPDVNKAAQWCRKAALLGNADAMLNMAECVEFAGHDYAEAFSWYRKAFDAGNMKAAGPLYRFYKYGRGVAKNVEEAELCLMAGVNSGDAESMFMYGTSEKKENGELSEPKIEWLIKAANAGSSTAMFNLGVNYANGQGVEKNQVEAFNWYLKAAENGIAPAMEQVSRLYSLGQGIGKNNEKAAQWCLTAAQNGSVRFMYLLGVRYANGDGVPKNEKEAFKWQLKASEGGDKAAMFNLAYYYEYGVGVEINFEASCMWLRKAADNGIVPAIRGMGLVYAVGRGVPQNDFLAYAWLSLAAAKGASDGMELRDEVRMRLSPEMVTKAQLLAKYWFENGTAQEESSSVPKKSHSDADMPKGSGTGFFITTDGYLLTAAHVVANATALKVSMAGNRSLPVHVIRVDEKNDLALLKVTGVFSALPVTSSGTVKLGADVFTIGFPNIDLQGASPKLTKGVVSGLNGIQDDPSCFQVSVAVQPGNSGGPLVNTSGVVVGVVTARLNDLATAKQTGMLPQNVNYAVKSAYVIPLLDAIPDSSPKPKTGNIMTFDGAVSLAERAVCIVLVY